MHHNSYLAAMCRETQDVNALFNLLGARLISATNGEARIELPVSSRLTQGAGAVAGGVLSTLADEAMAHAVISLLDNGSSTVTTEMNIRFLRGADTEKGTLIATARIVKSGRTLMTVEADVRDDAGRLLATAGGSFLVINAKKVTL